MKKIVTAGISIIFFAAVLPVFAGDGTAKPYVLEDTVQEPYLSQLKAEKKIRFVHAEDDLDMKLLPKSVYTDRVRSNRVEKKSGYITECLYLVDKKKLGANGTGGTADTSMKNVSRILRSISKMQGMEYYSDFYKKNLVLYTETYMLAGADSDAPIPDQNTGNADGQIVYVYQNDRTLGGCKYVLNYYQSDNTMYVTFNNLTKMMFGFVKAVDPRQFRANMLVMDCGSQYLVYISTDTGCPRIGIINSQINDAFNDRLDALYTWFVSQF